MSKVKFVIRDETGHSTKLIEPERADDFADELRDKGYMIVVKKAMIPYGRTIVGATSVEAFPLPTKG